MLTGAFFGAPVVDFGASVNAGVGNTSNDAAPAGPGAGLTPDSITGNVSSDIHGRASLALVNVAIVGFILFYLWTRNIQGGG